MKHYESRSHTRYDSANTIVVVYPYIQYRSLNENLRGNSAASCSEIVVTSWRSRRKVVILEGHLKGGHVHRCISIPPKFAVLSVVGFVRVRGKAQFRSSKLRGAQAYTSRGRVSGRRGYFACPR